MFQVFLREKYMITPVREKTQQDSSHVSLTEEPVFIEKA